MKRLSTATMSLVPQAVARPAYDRAAITTGIVHLGVGNFHRAHQACYTDAILAKDPRWGIFGVSLKRSDVFNALSPQDGLYALGIGEDETTHWRIIGALRALCVAPHHPMRAPQQIALETIHLLTLTVSEKGYHLNPATRLLREDDPLIVHDIAHPDAPVTTLGVLAAGLRLRKGATRAPLAIVPCDNLPANGSVLRAALLAFVCAQDKTLVPYIEDCVKFPSSMVDRIVPATTDTDRAKARAALGFDDAWPVMGEPFTQFVVEDAFGATPRPPWEEAGALFVKNVAPYEMMKLRLLNASHSAIAYLGCLMGYLTVADAMTYAPLQCFVAAMMKDEAEPALTPLAGFDYGAYERALLVRFSNHALAHKTAQIAMDGSQKVPQRLLASIRACLKQGRPFPRLVFALAAFIRFMGGADEKGAPTPISDPLASDFARFFARHGVHSPSLIQDIIGIKALFGEDLPKDPRFVAALEEAYAQLIAKGARACLEEMEKIAEKLLECVWF